MENNIAKENLLNLKEGLKETEANDLLDKEKDNNTLEIPAAEEIKTEEPLEELTYSQVIEIVKNDTSVSTEDKLKMIENSLSRTEQEYKNTKDKLKLERDALIKVSEDLGIKYEASNQITDLAQQVSRLDASAYSLENLKNKLNKEKQKNEENSAVQSNPELLNNNEPLLSVSSSLLDISTILRDRESKDLNPLLEISDIKKLEEISHNLQEKSGLEEADFSVDIDQLLKILNQFGNVPQPRRAIENVKSLQALSTKFNGIGSNIKTLQEQQNNKEFSSALSILSKKIENITDFLDRKAKMLSEYLV